MRNIVNSKNFARVLFSRSFLKIKSSQNGEITLSFTDVGNSCPSRDFYVTNMSFTAIRENKILAKISEFTVHCLNMINKIVSRPIHHYLVYRHIYPRLVLVQPRKTRPYITERLLMGRKESNQTKQTNLGSAVAQW